MDPVVELQEVRPQQETSEKFLMHAIEMCRTLKECLGGPAGTNVSILFFSTITVRLEPARSALGVFFFWCPNV